MTTTTTASTSATDHLAAPEAPDSDNTVALPDALDASPFAAWKESLASALKAESQTLENRVHALQDAFDETSVFIRGDLAWRKQLAGFHDKLNDAVHAHLAQLVMQLDATADTLATSVTASCARKDEQAKRAVVWHVRVYEDKLRRTRTSLAKEMDRFTRLEKCLRQEQTFQAKTMHDALVQQLKTEHAANEAALHALLRDLRSSYSAMELSNAQLLESLRAARADAERLKKMLKKQTASAASVSPQRNSGSRSPSRLSASTGGGISTVASVADVYVQSLKQSLNVSAQTIDELKKQTADLAREKDAVTSRVRYAEDATMKANDELAKVTQLLSESHRALVVSRNAVEQTETEMGRWRERFEELEFRTGSHEQELEAARRRAKATSEYVASLERQVTGAVQARTRIRQAKDAFEAWCALDVEQRDGREVERILAACVASANDESISTTSSTTDTDNGRSELERRLRYEYEARFGEQLHVRVSHERKRVLARIEMLCLKQHQELETTEVATAASRGPRSLSKQQRSTTGSASDRVLFQTVFQIVSDAYDRLGFHNWSATDLDALLNQIAALKSQLAQQQLAFGKLEQFTQMQTMVLAKKDLLEQEKELLLAELTAKYRELRAAHDAAQPITSGVHAEPGAELTRPSERPLTVYGHPQRLEAKRVRSRPVSASACLVASSSCLRDAEQRGREEDDYEEATMEHRRVSGVSKQTLCRVRPMSSAGPSSLRRPGRPRDAVGLTGVPTAFVSVPGATGTNAPERQVEHIRSVLKSELLELSRFENQLDDGSRLGPDGVRIAYFVLSSTGWWLDGSSFT